MTQSVSLWDYQFDLLHTQARTHTHAHTHTHSLRFVALQSAGSQRACMNLQEFLLSSSQALLPGDYCEVTEIVLKTVCPLRLFIL